MFVVAAACVCGFAYFIDWSDEMNKQRALDNRPVLLIQCHDSDGKLKLKADTNAPMLVAGGRIITLKTDGDLKTINIDLDGQSCYLELGIVGDLKKKN